MLSIEVSELLKDKEAHLDLTLVAGKKGLHKKINIPRIQKPGLALIGDTSKLHPGRVQVLGKSEITYLKSLGEAKTKEIIGKICKVEVACFIVTRDNEAPKAIISETNKHQIPLFKTPLLTSTLINRVTRFLEDRLTASSQVHGVLMDVYGVGILIIGKSGIGKSECALDLVLRGHRLVADDVVEIKKKPPATLYGMGSELIEHHMEIRGLGIINIKDLFGVAAIRDRKLVDIVVELVEWNPEYEYDRLGIDEHKYTILEVPLPYLKIPVSPGRNVTTIIEVAARNNLLKQRGKYSSKEFDEKLKGVLLKTPLPEIDITE
ncbi:MAG: HPr(Ser) kinase/phosphatase [Deltaproteobacteria bacterium]|nr:HPr(Ser) kinase/phosphatase [Deltaproteobacteria bacterium]